MLCKKCKKHRVDSWGTICSYCYTKPKKKKRVKKNGVRIPEDGIMKITRKNK